MRLGWRASVTDEFAINRNVARVGDKSIVLAAGWFANFRLGRQEAMKHVRRGGSSPRRRPCRVFKRLTTSPDISHYRCMLERI
jgi:hypothetical protein